MAEARWGLAALERRQREEGQRFWYNSYWKTDSAEQAGAKRRVRPTGREGLVELADIRTRLRERRRAARGEGGARQIRTGWCGGRGVFLVKKETTKGKEHEYWHVAWMIECKVHGMYLGSARKLDAEVARQKARKMKAEVLGVI